MDDICQVCGKETEGGFSLCACGCHFCNKCDKGVFLQVYEYCYKSIYIINDDGIPERLLDPVYEESKKIACIKCEKPLTYSEKLEYFFGEPID